MHLSALERKFSDVLLRTEINTQSPEIPLAPFNKLIMSHKFLLDTGGASVLIYFHAGLRSTFYGRGDP